MSEAIETTNVKFDYENSEDGEVYEITYPKCGFKVSWAPMGWWKTKCSCGYNWRVEITAIGEIERVP